MGPVYRGRGIEKGNHKKETRRDFGHVHHDIPARGGYSDYDDGVWAYGMVFFCARLSSLLRSGTESFPPMRVFWRRWLYLFLLVFVPFLSLSIERMQ
ncbi:hypothetical protein BS50DRAFT_576391 [Corynespora cassiicola Philippines]|uniref:Uncharacterized protein n=1 Tax=Corynespora cassiicola Philippines TaxID=1448308 RepID=A0A2T2NEB3_CORCC|nr:hypothetical protein BS50DRAFT_576391 [Corynespora cassiicola Philippines]